MPEYQERIEILVPGCKEKFATYIKEREGIIVWESQDLSFQRPDIFCPVKGPAGEDNLTRKPHWAYVVKEVVTDLSRFRFVKEMKEVERLKVKLRIRNMIVECTDASTRKVRARCQHWQSQYNVSPTYHFDPPPPLGFLNGPVEAIIEIPIFGD